MIAALEPDEVSPEEEAGYRSAQDRGRRAGELLADPLMEEAFAGVRAEYVQALQDAPIRDTEGLVAIKPMIATLDKVRGHLGHWITTGKMAEGSLAEIETRRDRWKARMRNFGR